MSFVRGIHFASHHWITTWLWRIIDPNKWVPQLPEADHGGELCRFGWMATGAGEAKLGTSEYGVYHQNSPVRKRTLMINRKQGVPCLKTPSLLTVDTTILRLSSSIAVCGSSQECCHCRNPNVLLFPPRHWMNMRRTDLPVEPLPVAPWDRETAGLLHWSTSNSTSVSSNLANLGKCAFHVTKGSLGYLSSMYFSTSLVLGEVAAPFPEIESWEYWIST